ncbi:MAG: hypothetical protein ACPGJS_09980 [Flammeovirgaceae bacterium]
MPERIFILIMTLLSLPVIGMVGHYVTEFIKAQKGGNVKELAQKVNQLLEENEELKKRLYNVETIVVDEKEYYALPPKNEERNLTQELDLLAKEKQKISNN